MVGQRSIDDVLVRGRELVETDTRQRLQAILDEYEAGIEVISVQLQDVKAPEEVRDAFDDVLRGRQERETPHQPGVGLRSRRYSEGQG